MNRILIILLSILTVVSISAVSAEEVFLQVKNGKLAEDVDISQTYSGAIGEVQITNISDDTLKIEIGNFIHLFAPVDMSNRKLLIEKIVEEITAVDDAGVSRSLTIDDVVIKWDRPIFKVYTCDLLEHHKARGQSYTVTIQGGDYIVGYINGYISEVLLNGNIITDKLRSSNSYTPIALKGNDTLTTRSSNTWPWDYYSTCHIVVIGFDNALEISGSFTHRNIEKEFDISPITYPVNIKVIDGLSGNVLSGVKVEMEGGIFSTVVNGISTIHLPRGEHTYIFSKEGYWDTNITINVDGPGKNIIVEMFPSNTILTIFQDPKDLTTYPSSVAQVTLTLRPIEDAYGTKLYITGVDVVKVKKDGVEIPKSADGSYVIGDIFSSADITILFATPDAVGEHQFVARFTASDIRGNQYTTQKTIYYTVQELPFIIQKPASWSVGNNTLTIIEQSGEVYTILLILRDANGTEVWTQSMAFEPYDSHTFTIPIPEPGEYVLEISAKGGAVTTYIPITATEPVKLLTPEIEGTEGSVVSVKLEIRNPSSEVRYYDVIVTGSIFDTNNTPKATLSIAPGESKTVEVKFKIPTGLEFDIYPLQVQVFEKGESKPIFIGDIVLKVQKGGLFLPIGGDNNMPLLIGIGAVILIILLVIGLYRVRT